jgi:hypothetical protein
MWFKEAETHKPTLAVQPWQFYGPRTHDILVVTFDARQTDIMPDGFVPPSCRATADFLSKCLFNEIRCKRKAEKSSQSGV